MSKKVAILMSTYNGSKYLEEQIESIENQTYEDITVFIRDDKSQDNTFEIIENLKQKYSNIIVIPSDKNLRPAKSFLTILKSVSNYGEFDYYAFADQDDVWLKEKVERAVHKLEELNNNDIPLLYFSDTMLVDKDLNRIKNVRKIKPEKIKPMNALIENIATGCTQVFNNKLKELLEKINLDEIEENFLHDDLAYKIASLTGIVVYDTNSYIYYRQHEGNVIGNSSTYLDKIQKRIKNRKKIVRLRSKIAKYILSNFKDNIKPEYLADLELIANYNFKRIKLLFNFNISRLDILDDLFYRIAIIFNSL
jgi:rhamnosyltransferase